MNNLDFFLHKIYLKNSHQKEYEASLCLARVNNKEGYITLKEYLSKSEQYFFNKMKYTHRKESFLLGRYAAKMAAKPFFENEDLTNIIIDSGIFNYPILQTNVASNYDLSISHCENIGAGVVFEKGLILGIDIEKIKDLFLKDCNMFFTEKEKDLFKTTNNSVEVSTMIWTAKEAMGKTIRTGLNTSPGVLEVKSINRHKWGYTCTFTNFPQYKAISIIADHFVLSIVIPSKLDIQTDFLSIKNFIL